MAEIAGYQEHDASNAEVKFNGLLSHRFSKSRIDQIIKTASAYLCRAIICRPCRDFEVFHLNLMALRLCLGTHCRGSASCTGNTCETSRKAWERVKYWILEFICNL